MPPRSLELLRRPAKKVSRVDDSIRRLIADMTESMYVAQGVGIAAPQIGVGLRVVVIGMPDEEPFALINPVVIKRSGTRRLDEGCLSVPGYRGSLTRSISVVVKALNEEGREIRVQSEGDLLAQALLQGFRLGCGAGRRPGLARFDGGLRARRRPWRGLRPTPKSGTTTPTTSAIVGTNASSRWPRRSSVCALTLKIARRKHCGYG